MEAIPRPARWKILLAFAIIYLVWGSTFLAIRVGVREVPPFLLAGMRFFAAGASRSTRGCARKARPRLLAASGRRFHFSLSSSSYSTTACSFGRRSALPSGIAAVMLATIPVFMALAEILFLRTQSLTLRLGLALLIGIGGVRSW